MKCELKIKKILFKGGKHPSNYDLLVIKWLH